MKKKSKKNVPMKVAPVPVKVPVPALRPASSPVITFSDMEKMAEAIAKSNLFGVKTKDSALALMLIAQAEGRHPAVAARDYHIIQGRPTLTKDAILARFQLAGGRVEWVERNDRIVRAVFSHPQGGSLEITWTIEMAQKIGLAVKDNWKNYPRQMLTARCISEGVRAVYPAVLDGLYTPEEVQDFDAPKQAEATYEVKKPDEESVITNITPETVLPFGPHSGKKLNQVPADYLIEKVMPKLAQAEQDKLAKILFDRFETAAAKYGKALSEKGKSFANEVMDYTGKEWGNLDLACKAKTLAEILKAVKA